MRLHTPQLPNARAGSTLVAGRCRTVRVKAVKTDAAPSIVHDDVYDGRLPFLQTLEQFVRPKHYAAKVLQGHKFAMGKISLPPEDALFIADTATARAWMNSEWQLGVITKWPDTFQKILGANSISMTQDPELHKQLREIMVPYFTSESIQRLMPGIQGTVRKHMARWAAQDTFNGYTSAKMMTFEVISNKALALGFTDSEIQEYSEVFRILVNGFMPPAINLPFTAFGKGLKAK
eukprot:GHRR01004320.1.p1 GENE.GHRR01004320.1~~GHRR01004320.1.p1  ORF type:complete len:234 (+),score=44.71 GHRR01004320.1:157-858(+)